MHQPGRPVRPPPGALAPQLKAQWPAQSSTATFLARSAASNSPRTIAQDLPGSGRCRALLRHSRTCQVRRNHAACSSALGPLPTWWPPKGDGAAVALRDGRAADVYYGLQEKMTDVCVVDVRLRGISP